MSGRIEILRKANYGYGQQGGFAEALVQYGFTNRSGAAIDPAIRSNYKNILDNETEIRAWWKTVPETKRRFWDSGRAIYKNWQAWKKRHAAGADDGQTEPRLNWVQKLQRENADLRAENTDLRRRVERAQEGGSLFEGADSVNDIVAAAEANYSADKLARVGQGLIAASKRKAKVETAARAKARERDDAAYQEAARARREAKAAKKAERAARKAAKAEETGADQTSPAQEPEAPDV